MNYRSGKVFVSIYLFLFGILLLTYTVSSTQMVTKSWAAVVPNQNADDPNQISNDLVKDNYLIYIKEKMGQGIGGLTDCLPGVGLGNLKSDGPICTPDQLNKQNNVPDELDDDIVGKLSDKLEKKQEILKDNFQKLRERLDKAIGEEEESIPLPDDIQKLIDKEDIKTTEKHNSKTGEHCKDGNVLDGASNEEDLKVLAECQDAVGDVMHTKKMDDGDYKFLLKLDDKYKFLINDKNEEKTDGFLVIEVVPKDQDIKEVDLPKSGDKVHVWGSWVTDKPKGWHEIHPTWEVTKE
jgi:hypothetical protein